MTVADRIKQRRIELGLSQSELAKRMGYSDKTSISKMENSEDDISMKKITRVAKALNTTTQHLMGWDNDQQEQYYLNPETAQIAQELYENKELRMLFDAGRNSKPEDLLMAAEMLKRFKETNPNG